jgi:hypothetical protein
MCKSVYHAIATGAIWLVYTGEFGQRNDRLRNLLGKKGGPGKYSGDFLFSSQFCQSIAQVWRHKKSQLIDELIHARQDPVDQLPSLCLQENAEHADGRQSQSSGRCGPFALIHEKKVGMRFDGQGDRLSFAIVQIRRDSQIDGTRLRRPYLEPWNAGYFQFRAS